MCFCKLWNYFSPWRSNFWYPKGGVNQVLSIGVNQFNLKFRHYFRRTYRWLSFLVKTLLSLFLKFGMCFLFISIDINNTINSLPFGSLIDFSIADFEDSYEDVLPWFFTRFFQDELKLVQTLMNCKAWSRGQVFGASKLSGRDSWRFPGLLWLNQPRKRCTWRVSLKNFDRRLKFEDQSARSSVSNPNLWFPKVFTLPNCLIDATNSMNFLSAGG